MTLTDTLRKIKSPAEFFQVLDAQSYKWIAKRLSGNDTGLTGTHQVGIYVPRAFIESVFPVICTTEVYNPDQIIDFCYFPQLDRVAPKIRAIYYNSKYFPKKGLKKRYNEFRITTWGGRSSPVQNPDNTGAICVLGFRRNKDKFEGLCWVSSSAEEEDQIVNIIGSEIEPGTFHLPHIQIPLDLDSGRLLPEGWYTTFPSSSELFDNIVSQFPFSDWNKSIDNLILLRRKEEYKLFKIVEDIHVMPLISEGFNSVSEFLALSLSVTNRRKSRSGRSLELNIEYLLKDLQLPFSSQSITENNKKPDFIFPSIESYRDPSFPERKLAMLACKTSCKDRWRQVINEADRINHKYLLTLQEGVSPNQLQEMYSSGIRLVAPEPLLAKYPPEWRSKILTFSTFIDKLKQNMY